MGGESNEHTLRQGAHCAGHTTDTSHSNFQTSSIITGTGVPTSHFPRGQPCPEEFWSLLTVQRGTGLTTKEGSCALRPATLWASPFPSQTVCWTALRVHCRAEVLLTLGAVVPKLLAAHQNHTVSLSGYRCLCPILRTSESVG